MLLLPSLACSCCGLLSYSGDDNQAEETLQALRFGERCALVSNSKQHVAASSAKEALASIDKTLAHCDASAASLKQRGKTHLPAFKSLMDRSEQLRQRRRAIADVARAQAASTASASAAAATPASAS